MMLSTLSTITIAGLVALAPGSWRAAPDTAHADITAEEQPEESSVMRVYDLRDLRRVTEPDAGSDGVNLAAFRLDAGSGAFSRGSSEKQAERADGFAALVERMADFADVARTESMIDGVYAVWGSRSAHETFTNLADRMRGLYSERYSVTVEWISMDLESAPSVGQTLEDTGEGADVLLRLERRVHGRAPATFSSTREAGYIREWQPIVSDSAVGYQPQVSTAQSGLELSVFVRAREGEGELVELILRGAAVAVEMRTVAAEASRSETGSWSLPVELPALERRLLDTAASVRLEAPTVLSVVEGFSPNSVRVLVVTIRKG